MVTLQTADNALKSVYLGVVANQLNVAANPLLTKIKRSNKDIWGKEIIKLAPYGLNGGVNASTEMGTLPGAYENQYVQFKASLKNLYGKIEITDKAIRSSANNIGAFVNLLTDEMEGLVQASAFNLGRMLYGDGSGVLATATSASGNVVTCDKVNNFVEGMVVDFYKDGTLNYSRVRILYVDRVNKQITVSSNSMSSGQYPLSIYVQGSRNNEITGLGAIFSNSETLYGVTRADYKWLSPYKSEVTTEISDNLLQSAIDFLDENADSKVNFIACSSAVRRAYQQYLTAYRSNIDIMNLEGGFKAISHNGIPLVADRFVDEDTLYLLNTDDFTLHELCDWTWIEGENGSILKQSANLPVYTASLVKYAELICDKPNGQAKISKIKSTVENPFLPILEDISSKLTPSTEGSGSTD